MWPPSGVILYSGYTVLCSDLDGSVSGASHGLYHFDTRLLSAHEIGLDGQKPELVTSAQLSAERWQGVLRIHRPGGAAEGPLLPQDALGLLIDRQIGPALVERLTVENNSALSCATTLEIRLAADFADIARTDGGDVPCEVRRTWLADERALLFDLDAERDGHTLRRALRIRVLDADAEAQLTDVGLSFQLDLPAGGREQVVVRYEALVDGEWHYPKWGDGPRQQQRAAWRSRRPRLEALGPLGGTLERASNDLFDLRNFELERRYLGAADGSAWVLNAGVPDFTGFFGRDTLTSAWQSALLGSRATRGALAVAAATQAQARDDWHDAEPGKMIHEIRRGPLSELGMVPQDGYYGTQTTAAMFVLALSEAWLWTADEDLLRRHQRAALRALRWADDSGDSDGDGFLEYESRSPRGLRNHGWKDSDEAIRHADGRLADTPITTVEEECFRFAALQRMAAISIVLGEDEQAARFEARAERLRDQWHEAFWVPDEGFYALALDGRKRPVESITSNPGHALGAGIVPAQHARQVAGRLMADDLFSGWGVRTLSTRHPSYNPFAYHLGAVWPVEQATFALGFKRYGLDEHADRLIGAVLEAAAACPDGRLPEALSGHSRASTPRPAFYPNANCPQAWSASAVVQLVQAMLGIYPLAPLGVLALVRPRLPEWVPALTLRNLRVGRAVVDLGFTRRPDGSAAHRVLRRSGPLIVVPAGPPQALERSPREELIQALVERAPGRLARAARLCLGLAA